MEVLDSLQSAIKSKAAVLTWLLVFLVAAAAMWRAHHAHYERARAKVKRRLPFL